MKVTSRVCFFFLSRVRTIASWVIPNLLALSDWNSILYFCGDFLFFCKFFTACNSRRRSLLFSINVQFHCCRVQTTGAWVDGTSSWQNLESSHLPYLKAGASCPSAESRTLPMVLLQARRPHSFHAFHHMTTEHWSRTVCFKCCCFSCYCSYAQLLQRLLYQSRTCKLPSCVRDA